MLPTGFGKSFIYQYYFAAARKLSLQAKTESPVLFVVSPLKAIASDQIKDLEDLGANGTKFTSESSVLDGLEKGKVDVVLGTAEEFLNPTFLDGLQKSEKLQRKLALIVVDECHTVETW